jgi:flagellar basal body-associated protein FliL
LTGWFVGNKTHLSERRCKGMSILWILLIVILVLALLGFFSRGYW